MNKNILVTGSNGQLGSELKFISDKYYDYNFTFLERKELDITKLSNLEELVNKSKFDFIINCAAYTNVDKAEEEKESVYEINAIAVQNLVKISEKNNIKLVHISTDYVFDGKSCKPYSENDPVNPIGEYGKSKLKGEHYLLDSNVDYVVVRTSWLYSQFGHNFIKTIIKLSNEKDELNVVYDQAGTPTNAADLADVILTILPKINSETKGIYHYSNEGVTSWYDFSIAIISKLKINCNIKPVTSDKFKTTAVRPHYSVLNKNKIKDVFNISILHWQKSLNKVLESL